MKTYKIHLIRHGLTQSNIDGKYTGHSDVSLCEQGVLQLNQMTKDYEYPKADALFCSPLSRCVETAKIIYSDMTPLIIPELIEYNFGDFEGKTAQELQGNEMFAQWLSGGADFAPPFGESNGEFGKRIYNTFIKIVNGLIKTGTTSASIVTHGGVIMAIMQCFAVPELPMAQWLAPNGCGFTICITPSIWSRVQKAEVLYDIPIVEGCDENTHAHNDYIDIFKEDLGNFNFSESE